MIQIQAQPSRRVKPLRKGKGVGSAFPQGTAVRPYRLLYVYQYFGELVSLSIPYFQK
jgi:hypothetical protein